MDSDDEEKQVIPQEEEVEVEVGSEKKKKRKAMVVSNKLIIKLKSEHHDDAVSADDVKPLSCCKHCAKEFSSPKALGAHMRVHSHPLRAAPPPTLTPAGVRIRNGGGGGGGDVKNYLVDLLKDGKPTCNICSKSFVSPKSLFGHMRCHPERRWRGMHPPSVNKELPTTTSSSSGAHHGGSSSWRCSPSHHRDKPIVTFTPLDRCLPRWPVKAKRGRKSSILMPRDNHNHSHNDEVFCSAVHGLMMLQDASMQQHQHQHDGCGGGEIRNGEDTLCKCCNQSNKQNVVKSRIHEGGGFDDDNDLGLKCSTNYDCGDEGDVYETGYKEDPEEIAMGKKRKTINIKDLEYSSNINDPMDYMTTTPAASASARCYKCVTCSKSFPSPQALGGHRSSAHNKIFIKNTVFENKCGASRVEEFGHLNEDINTTGAAVLHPPPQARAMSHVCRTCNKVFPSGQALGGHKRCHRQAPPSSSSSSSPPGQQLVNMLCDDLSGSPAASATTKSAAALDFDLNEIPVDDHDEE